MRNFRQLDVWEKSHQLTIDIYRLTSSFPKAEQYGLSSQLQRASASVGANLAEGCGRDSDVDFRRFVHIACGSACEVECHLLLARDLGLIGDADHHTLDKRINEVKRMLTGLSRYLGSTRK